jgi:drug/metabolite transporter (DMT)-like permease
MIQRGAAARVTSLIYLSPPTTALMGWAVFGEVMSWMAIGGMALAMAGVALAVTRK